MLGFKAFITEGKEKGANWKFPSTKSIGNEYDREYTNHFRHHFGHIYPTKEHFVKAVKKSPVKKITKEFDQSIHNRSHCGTMKSLHGLIKSYKSYPKHRNKKTLNDLQNRITSKKSVDMPIVTKHKDGSHRVFSGNTRLDINFMHHDHAHAVVLDVSKKGV